MRTYVILCLAILCEVIATSALARSNGFSRPGPVAICALFYGVSFWLLSITLKTMPTGVVYAIWSGLGIVLITLVAWIWQKQVLDWPALAGLGLIVSGVLVINLFSSAVTH